ncbi:hypothetical protein R50073_41630 [Maricurvus nonylphenolicus]|uniref:DUF1330 domain-containing protein n=1 Tax=Maricurvus nonylphenolicus TaxID=1008307 RepID=UPI0036F2C016
MSKNNQPAFLLVCGETTGAPMDPEYVKRSAPIAMQTGLMPIAIGEVGNQVEVLEGELPEGVGFVAIEQFPSMDALKEFYHSEQYQSAIPFRKDSFKINFLAAVDGLSQADLEARAKAAAELVE